MEDDAATADHAAVSLIIVAEDAAATAEPAEHEGGGGERRLALLLDRLRGVIAVRPAAMCALVAFHLALSAYEARSWMPWRQGRLPPPVAAFALAYAAVAALMWFDWRMEEPQRRRPLDATERRVKLAARMLASVVVGVVACWTVSPSPCGLLLFIWYFGSE